MITRKEDVRRPIIPSYAQGSEAEVYTCGILRDQDPPAS